METLLPRVSSRGFHTKGIHSVDLCASELFLLDTTLWDSVTFICAGLNFVDQMQACYIVSNTEEIRFLRTGDRCRRFALDTAHCTWFCTTGNAHQGCRRLIGRIITVNNTTMYI